MAVRQLSRQLQALQLQITTVTTLPTTCRAVHTTSWCLRRLDSHAYPPSRDPSSNGRWQPRKKFSEMYEYTVEPLPNPRTGGRGPNGRIWNHRRAGGWKKPFHMIDWVRGGPAVGQPLVERVNHIFSDLNRSAHIAMVVSGERKRYILATANMKPGDLISSSNLLSKAPVRANEGDSYPLGSLPVGTLVNCVEVFEGAGALVARSAGVTAQLVRKLEERCVVRLPSKREINVSSRCQATVGRVSNIDHHKRVLGKAGAKRWLGFKPNSGRWHRKTGRFGRKIKAIKKAVVYNTPKQKLNPKVHMYPVNSQVSGHDRF